MASKKNTSKAQRAASGGNRKTASSSSGKKSGKTASKKSSTRVKTEYEATAPHTAFMACLSLFLFVLFVVICINPDGKLLQMIQAVVYGLFGQAGFYIAIPALFYLFFINTFRRKRAVRLRSVCTILFVLACGSIFHLAVQQQPLASGLDVFPDLYNGGLYGATGGVICGGAASLLRWSCGIYISYIILCLVGVFSLLGALEITIPSIYRAIINRPKDDWMEDEEERIETAARVVNHIANKNIEHKRRRREKLVQGDSADVYVAQSAARVRGPSDAPSDHSHDQKKVQAAPVRNAANTSSPADIPSPSRKSGVMSTIDLDIETPVASGRKQKQKSPAEKAAVPVPVHVDEDVFAEKEPIEKRERYPEIPAFVRQEDISAMAPAKPVVPAEKPEKVTAKDTAESAQQVAAEIAQTQSEQNGDYCFPPIDLLKDPVHRSINSTDELRENSERLAETLASFKIDAKISNVTRGPSVTRYEVVLNKGVRLNKLTGSADDIALSLGAQGVRIAAVPGKISVVGIEVPNRSVTMVALREVISSSEFNSAKSRSSFAVGKDIAGSCIVGNIAKMPHMLIAGTTGSGKSVCMNSIIISLLYKARPEEVKLIMVDPKMVELGIYNGIPHLMIPVVTDPKKAAGSLQWAVTEMLRRYKLMSDKGVRDLESYNKIVAQEENGQTLPQVVIIIDELADLMLVAAKEVEDSICRVAQMGRASGMHLIIATQRPSADVITGLMKANIPSRIAFSVASAMESRIILDTQGAEKLVGKGDMLYAPIGCGKPLRVQGCFVTDGEVEAVAEYVKNNHVAVYDQQVIEEIDRKAQQTGKAKSGSADPEPNDAELDGDEMLPAAVDVILETGQASVSMLQRRLKLGYARAARIVDEMEEKGIVGPFQGSKPREILISKEQWMSMRNGGHQMEMDEIESNAADELL